MEILLQFVGIEIKLPVEIAQHEPVGVEDLLGAWTVDGVEQQRLELEVAQPVVGTAADVVEAVPELVGQVEGAEVGQQSSGVLHGGPLQHARDGHVEHNGIVLLEDGRVEDARLAHADPVLKPGFGEGALRDDLADAIIVIDAGEDRVSGAPPEGVGPAVGGLCHRADIDRPDVVGVGLRLDGLHHICRRRGVHLQRFLGEVVGGGRDHPAHVQHVVGARDARQHIFVVHQVAPYDLDAVLQGFQFLYVLLAMSGQDDNVEFVVVFEQFVQSGPAHNAGGTGEKYGFLHFLF